MLDTQPDSLRVRPDYFGPASYYTRRVDVGVRGVAARKTNELVARLAVGLLDVAANAALPRSIPRVDVADRYPCSLGLVADLRLKVGKGPGVENASLRPRSSYPRTDAFEISRAIPSAVRSAVATICLLMT